MKGVGCFLLVRNTPDLQVIEFLPLNVMALLLEHITLTLPLPDKQLAIALTRQPYPLARHINTHRIDFTRRNLKRLDRLQSVQIKQRENTIRLADTQQLCILS